MWRRNGGLGPPGGTARVARGSTGEDQGGRCFPPQLQRHNLLRWQKSMKETVDETVVVFAPRTGRSIWGTNRLWSLALALTRENSHSQVLAATDRMERRCPIMLITGACARTCRAGFSSFFVVDRPRVPPPIRAPVQDHELVPTSMTVNTLWTCAATVSPSVARITAPAVANRQRHAVVLAAAATLPQSQIYRAQSHRVTKVVVQ